MTFYESLSKNELLVASQHDSGLILDGDFVPPFEVVAAYHIGLDYSQNGNHTKAKHFYEKAIEFYRAYNTDSKNISHEDLVNIAQESYLYALFNLGVNYRDALAGELDYTKARQYFEEVAQYNDADALYFLGCIYAQGRGVEIDDKLAFQYYLKAAELNCVYAQNSLGRCYEFGLGTNKDLEQAKYWYQMAADQGDDLAAENLSRMYGNKNISLNGSYNEYSEDENIPKFDKIISSDNIRMESPCNDCLHSHREYDGSEHYQTYCDKNRKFIGIKVKCKDFIDKESKMTAAEALTQTKCCSNCPHKEEHLLKFAILKYCTVRKSYPHLYKVTCKARNLESCNAKDLEPVNDSEIIKAKKVCELLKEGTVRIDNNDYSGIELLKKAASLGSINAIFGLGLTYHKKNDFLKALDYYRIAADYNHPEALNNLGYMYENGLGVQRNEKKAMSCFLSAVKLGSPSAIKMFKNMAKYGNQEQRTKANKVLNIIHKQELQSYSEFIEVNSKKLPTVPKQPAAKRPVTTQPIRTHAVEMVLSNIEMILYNNQELIELYKSSRKFQRLIAKAAKGNAYSEYQIASLVEKGTNNLIPNPEKALEWYEKSVTHGYKNALKDIDRLKEKH